MRHLVWMALLASGCLHEDFCKNAVHYCTGNMIHVCIDNHDEEHRWEARQCEQGYCVEIAQGNGAICASEPAPRAACEGVVDHFARVCDGAQQITCSYGYASVKFECAGPEYCVPALSSCTVRPGPQANCAARTPMEQPYPYAASYCDADALIRCTGEFATSETACGAGRCYETAQAAGCTESTTADPVCDRPMAEYPYRVCSNNTNIECLGPYRISSFRCSSGVCVANGCQG